MKKYLLLWMAPALLFLACDKTPHPVPASYPNPEIPVNPPAPTPPPVEPTVSVGSADDAQNAIDDGSTEITITQPLANDATFSIPNNYTGDVELKIVVPAGGKAVTITQDATRTGTFPKLELKVADAGDLTLNTPAMSVDFDGSVSGTLTASTAANTLTILQNASVGTLKVNQGNVRVFGTVTSVATPVAEGSKVLWGVGTAEELIEKLEESDPATVQGVILTADISSSRNISTGAQVNQDVFRIGFAPGGANPVYYQPTPRDGFVFDGNQHTISGYAVNNVLAVYANKVTIKNLTVEQTTDQKTNKTNNGISIYRVKDVILDSVKVQNVGKAGIIVNASTATSSRLFASGNAWGAVNVSLGTAPAGGEAPAFTFTTGDLGTNGMIYVDVYKTGTAPGSYSVTVPAGWYYGTYGPTASAVKYYSPTALPTGDGWSDMGQM